jgi:hypothetical protein
MNSRHILTVASVLGGLMAASILVAAADFTSDQNSDKVLVTDGHVFHDTGNLWNHVTNFGLIGSQPTSSRPYSDAPSATWNGVDYLWAAGFWVGGTVLGEHLVSTGQHEMEFTATDAPGDTIFEAAQGDPQGMRFPWPGADDDGDGVEDEDPLDGLDNDLDGLFDEDFAAISDQHFRCVMHDYLAEIVDLYPDHTPLNLDIVQESFQWADPLAADFIGYEYRVTNVGVTDIENVYCGMFADFDIGADPDDDMAGSWIGDVNTPWGSVPVSVGYMRNDDVAGAPPGWVGFVMCGVETDAAAGDPDNPLAMHSFQRFSGNASFEQGGDPTNDDERYQLLSMEDRDPDTLPGMYADFRTLVSAPGITTLAPGETVIFRTALVIGDGLEEMLATAGEAVVTALGQYYDRDGDPANGEEFHVPWIRPDEGPVPAVTGRLIAALNRDAVSLDFDVRHSAGGWSTVDRRETEGVPRRSWLVDQESGSIMDDDTVGWPRIYDLVLKSTGGPDLVLDTVEVVGPAFMPLRLVTEPNPFNPHLTIKYTLSVPGTSRLEILDLAGRLVQVLFDEYRPAGDSQASWNGRDRRGQAAASGVYLVRLVTQNEVIEKRVTLLR